MNTPIRTAMIAAAIACAAPAAAKPVASLLEMRQRGVVIQEWDMSCGAAALATVLNLHLEAPLTEKRVAYEMLLQTTPERVKERGGFSLLDMKRFAEAKGFRADGYTGVSTAQLVKMQPVIIPVDLGDGAHFVVFRGVRRGAALISDPAFGNRSLPLADFEASWQDSVALAVKPKAGDPASASQPEVAAVEDEEVRLALDDRALRALADSEMIELAWSPSITRAREANRLVLAGSVDSSGASRMSRMQAGGSVAMMASNMAVPSTGSLPPSPVLTGGAPLPGPGTTLAPPAVGSVAVVPPPLLPPAPTGPVVAPPPTGPVVSVPPTGGPVVTPPPTGPVVTPPPTAPVVVTPPPVVAVATAPRPPTAPPRISLPPPRLPRP